jgi:hypothetical protein
MAESDDPRRSFFDRKLGALFGLPDVLSTSPATIQNATPMVGDAQSFIIQTYRQNDSNGKAGYTTFIQAVDAAGAIRLVLPPSVTACIARQRDALLTKMRKRNSKAAATDRKNRGIEPGFAKGRKRSTKTKER